MGLQNDFDTQTSALEYQGWNVSQVVLLIQYKIMKKKKSQLHVDMANKRWAKVSKKKRSEIMSAVAKARWAKNK